MRHAAPALALVFFTLACALVITDPWAPADLLPYAVTAVCLSNAALLWAYYGIAPPRPRMPHGRRKA